MKFSQPLTFLRRYSFRLLLAVALLGSFKHSVSAEWPAFKREADKLAALRDIVRERKLSPALEPQPKFCSQFLSDAASGRNIEVVEPDVRATSSDDPRLEKWHRCDRAEQKDTDAKDPRDAYLGLYNFGGPPFRYYRIDMDRNAKNGLEEVLYYERQSPASPGAGYIWVHLERCVVRGNVPLDHTNFLPDPPTGYTKFSLLLRYRAEPVVVDVLPFKNDNGAISYHLTMQRFGKRQPVVCPWQ